jgi:hypothetical protein
MAIVISIREELTRSPHDDSAIEKFVRERSPLPEDVVELKTQIRSIVSRMEAAIANHDFAKARLCSAEERTERDKLLCCINNMGSPTGFSTRTLDSSGMNRNADRQTDGGSCE